jgi:glycosyltransferase involved in cell wall biosynthesis
MHDLIPAEVPEPECIPSISAVMPAYNQDAFIERSVLDLAGALGRLTTDYGIIVVDDGSRDRTADLLAGIRTRFPELPLRIVTHVIVPAFKELLPLWRNLDHELAQDGARRRIPLSCVTVRVPG